MVTLVPGYMLLQTQDEYPWTSCNSFEATKKNCPRGEACLKLTSFEYAWNWAMRCKAVNRFYIIDPPHPHTHTPV
jgi:hypothetical protein